MMAKIVHTAKQTVNAIVDIQSARAWDPSSIVVVVIVTLAPSERNRKTLMAT